MKNIKSFVIAIFAIVLIAVIVSGCSKNETSKTETKETPKTETKENSNTSNDAMRDMENKEHAMIELPSMQCNTCKRNIETAVKEVSGVIDVKVDKDKKVAHIHYDKNKTDVSKIENAITAAGYDANDKKKDMKAYDKLDDCCKIPKDQKEKK